MYSAIETKREKNGILIKHIAKFEHLGRSDACDSSFQLKNENICSMQKEETIKSTMNKRTWHFVSWCQCM